VLLNDVRSKFSLRPEFENLPKLFFGAYKSDAIVFRVVFIIVRCLTRLTFLTFVYCAFDMIQLKRDILLRLYSLSRQGSLRRCVPGEGPRHMWRFIRRYVGYS